MLFPAWAKVLLPTCALIMSNFFFSTGQILSSMAFHHVAVLVVVYIRTFFALTVVASSCLLGKAYPPTVPQPKQRLYLGCLGVCGQTTLLTWFTGISLTSVSTAGIVAVLQPVIALIISLLMRAEKYAPYKGVAIGLGMLGNILLVGMHATLDGGNTGGAQYILGCVSLFVSCISYTFYLIVQSKYIDKAYSPVFIQTCSFSSGLIILTVISAVKWDLYKPLITGNVPVIVWVACIYTGLISGPVSNVLLTYGLRRTSPMTAAISTFLEAFFNLVGGAVVLGETLSPYQCVGGVLLVGAVIVFTRGQMDDLKKKQDEPITTEPSDATDQEMREVVEAEHTPMQL